MTSSEIRVNFPLFEWRDIGIKEQLGSGTFGSVYLVNYEKEEQNVIVKKMKEESTDAKRRFEKEAAILNTVKGHRNVGEFLQFCQEPYAIMMEYSCFDFRFLEVDKKVSSLEDFIHFIDAEFEFEFELCARDVVTGLHYLHSHNIAHRDLTLGNTLVSNQNYITMDGDWAKVYAECLTCQRPQVKKLEQENEKVACLQSGLVACIRALKQYGLFKSNCSWNVRPKQGGKTPCL